MYTEEKRRGATMRILVAEDEIDLAEALKMMLEMQNIAWNSFMTGKTRCFTPNQHRMI